MLEQRHSLDRIITRHWIGSSILFIDIFLLFRSNF